jgi:carboxypeptidase C (cathepsin A)
MEGDIEYIGDFIRDFVTKEGRWNSPKYIAGESYGTLRACGLSEYLLSKHSLYLNGLVLISCAIDFKTIDVSHDNDLPITLFLPTYAATACYHGRLPTLTLEEAVSQSRDFALDTFAPALFKTGSIPPHLYNDIAIWTGLSSAFVHQQSGLIDDFTYFGQFKASERKVIGRFDSRFTGDVLPTCRYLPYHDPSAANASGIFTASFNNYLYNDLNCKSEWPRYEIFTLEGHCKWKYDTRSYPNQMEALRYALAQNPSMQIFTACGYFDLATPFAAAEYCFKRLHLPREENVTFGYYEGGHMFYTNPEALKKFKSDLKDFYIRS